MTPRGEQCGGDERKRIRATAGGGSVCKGADWKVLTPLRRQKALNGARKKVVRERCSANEAFKQGKRKRGTR